MEKDRILLWWWGSQLRRQSWLITHQNVPKRGKASEGQIRMEQPQSLFYFRILCHSSLLWILPSWENPVKICWSSLPALSSFSLFVVVLQEERDRFRNKHTFEEYREVEGRRKTLFSPSDFWGHGYFTKRETVEDWFQFAKTKWYKKIFAGVEWYNLLSIWYLCIRILHSGEIENVIHRIKYLNISNFRDVLTRRIVFYK